MRIAKYLLIGWAILFVCYVTFDIFVDYCIKGELEVEQAELKAQNEMGH